jgi:hypothetical protein
VSRGAWELLWIFYSVLLLLLLLLLPLPPLLTAFVSLHLSLL